MPSRSPSPSSDLDIFADPPSYYPPSPPPTSQTYLTLPRPPLNAPATITLHLVGHSPLEAHHLWNGSRVVASHFESHPSLVTNKTVLELGAGAGLPSIVAGMLGALKVVVTDFPDPDIVDCLRRNVAGCELIPPPAERVVAAGYVWGAEAGAVLSHLEGTGEGRFDVLVLADLLFRHSEHGKLLRSIEMTMKRARGSRAYVVFTSYRPWLQHKDLNFFELARERGFVVEKVLEKKMERPLFEEDPGDEEVRKTVTGWTLAWPEEVCEGGEWRGDVIDREAKEAEEAEDIKARGV
ncbi:hypothetical protein QBC39DRAFT_404947 [Podospora conica]|nr:hypothetical protein QBC39DRAFT_404947 [Schizothecium conicum]